MSHYEGCTSREPKREEEHVSELGYTMRIYMTCRAAQHAQNESDPSQLIYATLIRDREQSSQEPVTLQTSEE